MSQFDEEIAVQALGQGLPAGKASQAWSGHVHPTWNIGANPNGGYLLALAAAALRQATPAQPDALSATVHYLRPGLSGQACRIDTQVLRAGRQLSTVRATLVQDGSARLEMMAAMGDLGAGAVAGGATTPLLTLPMPQIPPPEQCASRSADAQGVPLPILDRLDIRLHRAAPSAGHAARAEISGWVRFADGRAPDTLACLLFADAFPPAVFGLLGVVGWVPTVELTVHVRARPAPGWMLGRFWSHDLRDGRVIEDGALWDSRGQLVLQSRQLALVRAP